MKVMMRHRIGLGVMVALAAVAVTGAPAQASGRITGHVASVIPAAPVLPIELSPAGFILPGPNPRPAGLVTFRVSTSDARGHYWSIFALRNGASLADVGRWFVEGELPDHSISLPALHNLYTNVEFNGGLAVYPSGALDLTVTLKPDTTYYITDALGVQTSASAQLLAAVGPVVNVSKPTAVAAAAPAPFAVLAVTSESQLNRPPAFSSVLLASQRGDAAVLTPIGAFKAHGAFLFYNTAILPQEANFLQVLPGSTDADVQGYFDAVLHGGSAPNPFIGAPGGVLIISPGIAVILRVDFNPGSYVALSFPTNWDTGVKQAYEGVHRVVRMS